MSVEIYAGVAYGFTLERGSDEELQNEIDELGYKFEVIRTNADSKVVVGLSLATGSRNEGDILTDFEPIEEGVIWALEELRSKMDVYSEIKFTFYFYYE